MRTAVAGFLGLAVLAAACGGSPTAPTLTTQTPVTDIFSGMLGFQGVATYSVTPTEASDVTLTLVSLTSGSVGAAVTSTVGLAYGLFDENMVCVRASTVRVAPGLITQLKVTSTAESHCVDIFDVGGLTGDTNFAVRVTTTPVLYKPTPPPAGAGTETFSSSLPMLSSVSRSFTASQAGVVSVTLTSAGPPSTVVVGLGLGVPRADGGGCFVSASLNTTAGAAAQISRPVEPGSYCVRIYDPGTLPNLVNFTITAAHP